MKETSLITSPGPIREHHGCAPIGFRSSAPAARPQMRWLAFLIVSIVSVAGGWSTHGPAAAEEVEIHLLGGDPSQPIVIRTEAASRWDEGQYEIVVAHGSCLIQQGRVIARAQQAVLWIFTPPPWKSETSKVIAYLENSTIEYLPTEPMAQTELVQKQTSEVYVGRFYSHAGIQTDGLRTKARDGNNDALYRRALAARNLRTPAEVQPAQFDEPLVSSLEHDVVSTTEADRAVSEIVSDVPQLNPNSVVTNPPSGRRIRLVPRSSVPMQWDSFPSSDGTEQVSVITSGVNILIEGLDQLGTVEISTDRVVIWMPLQNGNLNFDPQMSQQGDVPIELYLEGNIVFRQGDRIIYAASMYYNVQGEVGVIMEAELLTAVPEYEGLLRLKADVLRQVNRNQFSALGAAVTSSRLGVPRYWFQSGNIQFEDHQTPVIDPATGTQAVDPLSGQPAVAHQRWVSSRNNFVYLAGVPVFYWPVMSTDFTKPGFFVERVRFGQDQVFGTQLGVDFNMLHLFGIQNFLPDTAWTTSLDYLSDRGWGGGTDIEYKSNRFIGFDGPVEGQWDVWGLRDRGVDNLGLDRRILVPEEDHRGRVFWRHRQQLQGGFQVMAEAGYISDRNFLEQYFEYEWDQFKDQTTGVEIKQLIGNGGWSVAADGRMNDFFTQTEWLPKLDHFLLGQPLLRNRLTWFEHTQIGYGKLATASTPVDPVDAAKFNPMAWEADVEGIRVGTRNEIDLPFELGAMKIVPYVLGDVMHWGQDVNGEDATRLLGQAGVRASLPMWRVDPWRQSTLFNVNGIAHKVTWDAEFLWADSSEDLSRFALYDSLDDDSNEHFRRRFVDDNFGGIPNVPDFVPFRFEERLYALRSGMQRWVMSPSAEIADDLMVVRLASRNRWQTKRGLPGHQRIIDWITLDIEGSLFPKADRDNFGAEVGMIQYDCRWHVGDRMTMVSDGYADTFDDALRMFSLGGYVSRPARGSLYLGFRNIEGPISSNILSASYHYRMSEKWITSLGSLVDFGDAGNIGQHVEITRIGESFLVGLGLNVDQSRGNVGFTFTIEPRFLPFTRRGRVGGVQIPPAGARGLE